MVLNGCSPSSCVDIRQVFSFAEEAVWHGAGPQNHFLKQPVSFPLLPSSVLHKHEAAASPADAKRWMSVIVCVMTECFNQVLCRARALSQFLFRRSITWPAAGRCSCFLPGDAGNTCPAQLSSPGSTATNCQDSTFLLICCACTGIKGVRWDQVILGMSLGTSVWLCQLLWGPFLLTSTFRTL